MNNFKRVTFIVALFIFCSLAQAGFANHILINAAWANSEVKTETYKDVIEKAQNLFLQGARGQALRILLMAQKKEGKKSGAHKELQTVFQQIASHFLSDKSQSQFEIGLALIATDPRGALEKIAESQKTEIDNLDIEIQWARTLILMSECDRANEKLEKISEYAVFSDQVNLLVGQVALCMGNFNKYLMSKPIDHKKSELALFWLTAETEYLFKSSSFSKAIETTDLAIKLDPGFPEVHYWKWRAQLDKKDPSEGSALKYVSLCKSMTPRNFRKYLSEPFLCTRVSEVESFLKKYNNIKK